MKKGGSYLLAAALWVVAGWTTAQAQEQTVGLFLNDERAYEGYTLIMPMFHQNTYLIDNQGQVVHSWEHAGNPIRGTYLLPNGNLLRANAGPSPPNPAIPSGGILQEIAWDGSVVWEFAYLDSLHGTHHDYAKMPNDNVLIIAWEYKSPEETNAEGRNPATLPADGFAPDHIIEVRPISADSSEIVWQWHVWDHLIQEFDSTKANFGVVREHPELVDLNYNTIRLGNRTDWLHTNSVNYNAELDQIILSVPTFEELWVIDHSTTTEEAAGHTGGRSGKGGDLLYRWGNPAASQAGLYEDRLNFFAHDAAWIEPGLPGAGNVLIFDNGRSRRDTTFSVVYELALPMEDDGSYSREADGSFTPAEIVWRYIDPSTFYSIYISGQQRLPNGNTLIASGMTGRIFEITTDDEIVWEYVNPVVRAGPLVQGEAIAPLSLNNPRLQNGLFRALRYGPDYPAFDGKDLTPRGPIEILRVASENEPTVPADFVLAQNYPNPFNPTTAIPFTVPRPGEVTLTVYNALGQRVTTLTDRRYGQGRYVVPFDGSGLPSGVYFYRLESEGFSTTKTMLLLK